MVSSRLTLAIKFEMFFLNNFQNFKSLTAPLNDERLNKEFYTRTFEQDDDLGLNDMCVDNYENLGVIKEENDSEMNLN